MNNNYPLFAIFVPVPGYYLNSST